MEIDDLDVCFVGSVGISNNNPISCDARLEGSQDFAKEYNVLDGMKK